MYAVVIEYPEGSPSYREGFSTRAFESKEQAEKEASISAVLNPACKVAICKPYKMFEPIVPEFKEVNE